MLKKLFITSLLVGASVFGFAQVLGAETKASAKTVVENSQKEMLEKMSLKIKGDKKAKVKNLKKKNFRNGAQQFLFQENLIDTVLMAKSHSLIDVFDKMCKKNNVPSKFTFEGINVGSMAYKEKKGKMDTNVVIVPVSFQTHTIAKNNVSDVKYKVTFTWEVKKGKATPISVSAEPISLLSSEKKAMLNEAKAKIIEWYANLPQTLDKQYSEKLVSEIQPIAVTVDDIKADLPTGRNFTITNVKDIRIDIDPYQFIKDSERHLYTNPSAYLIITPIFNITVDGSFKTTDVKVEYSVKEPVKPVADNEKIARKDAAEATVAKLAQELSSYVSSRDEKQKLNVQSLFNAKDGNVEFSYLYPNGTERINSKNAPQYLSLLKGESLDFIDYNIDVVDDNWESVVCVVNQYFKSKTYSDYTQKKVYLTYDAEKKSYYIDKIEVVPNSTKIQ